MNYKGVSCPVCGQPFQEGDDIVVCPECGAPHHRACYKQLGHCAMEQQLHPQHLSWQNPNDQPPAAAADGSDDIICPNCGLFCHSEDESCPNCHFPLKNKTESQPSNNNQRPVVENPFDEVSGQEQSLQFDLTGLGGWQIAAQLLMYVRFGVSIYCGFTANRHYYNHCRQKISQLKAASTGGSPNEYYQTLSSVGGASPLPPLLAIAAVIALTLCASIVMALLLGVQ